MPTRIYHNPRCSKSRETLKLLEAQAETGADIEIEVIKYLDTPPNAAELLTICQQLGIQATNLLRSKESRFKELGLSVKDARSEEDWCKIMADNPILIERPIVIHNQKAALGRPPETVLTLF